MPSEEVCSFWAHALRRARDFADPAQVLPKEGNYIPAEEKVYMIYFSQWKWFISSFVIKNKIRRNYELWL